MSSDDHIWAEPILKWAGGKRRLAPRILSVIGEELGYFPMRVDPARRIWLIEPFVGSGALSLYFLQNNVVEPADLVWNDLNQELMYTYGAMVEHAQEISTILKSLLTNHETYMAIRSRDLDLTKVASSERVATAVRMIFLNKAGFNGLYRVNRKGEFNVPWGGDGRVVWSEGIHRNLLAFSQVVGRLCGLYSHTFSAVLTGYASKPGPGRRPYVYYCDPPYLPASPTSSFTSYSAEGFSTTDHEELARAGVEAVMTTGGLTVISSSDVPAAREIYGGAGYRLIEVEDRRAISAKTSGRGKVGELLCVMNGRKKP